MKKFIRTRGAGGGVAGGAGGGTNSPSESRDQPPPRLSTLYPKTNGYALTNGNGGAAAGSGSGAAAPRRRRDERSTLSSSRYWCGSEGSGAGRGALFEDGEFPAAAATLGLSKFAANDVLWMRPHELCARPVFFSCSEPESDGSGGAGGTAEGARWVCGAGGGAVRALAAAAAALAAAPRLLQRALRAPQPLALSHPDYNGKLTFELWVFGSWRRVVIDDRVPVRGGRLACGGSVAAPADFTLPLLEKAYAKLCGGYERARRQPPLHALHALAGGVAQLYPLSGAAPARAAAVLHAALPRSTLLVAVADPLSADWAPDKAGLVAAQPYCVTGLARVRAGAAAAGGAEAATLVRVRGAAGRGRWRGAWAPDSAQWRALHQHDRDLLALRTNSPAEFWMSVSDLCAWFSALWLVHVGPDEWVLEPALAARRPWRCVLARRRWTPGYNAGGPPPPPHKHRGTRDKDDAYEIWSSNPQFQVQIPEGGEGEARCHVVVSVMQQYSPGGGAGAGGRCRRTTGRLHGIGFALYSGNSIEGPPLEAAMGRAREVVSFLSLPAGQYRLVPHAARAGADAAFLLRVYTDLHADIWEVNEDNVLLDDAARALLAAPPARLPPLPRDTRRWLQKQFGSEWESAAVPVRAVCSVAGAGAGAGAAMCALGAGLAGRVAARRVSALCAVAAAWRAAFLAEAAGRRRVPGAAARRVLRACGVAVSNKVLEAVLLRHADPRGRLALHAALHALAQIHLAHERHRQLESKIKSNPLSLEEMILMTIYS